MIARSGLQFVAGDVPAPQSQSCGSDLIEETAAAGGGSIRLLSWITIVAYGEQYSLPVPSLSWR